MANTLLAATVQTHEIEACEQKQFNSPETGDERPAHWLHDDIRVQRPPQQLRIALVDGRHLCIRSRVVSDPSSLRIWCQERLAT